LPASNVMAFTWLHATDQLSLTRGGKG